MNVNEANQRLDGAPQTSLPRAPPDGDRPIPPRYWWLKRIALGVLTLFVLLLLVRLWWGHIGETRFQAELARYRAASQPVEPEDFDPPPIKDEDNAALLYFEAINAFFTPPNVAFDALKESLTTDVGEHLADLRAWVEANARPLELAHDARDLRAADWGTRPRSPMLTKLLPSLSSQRQLARLMANAALYHCHVGEHEAAVARSLDLMGLASAIDRWPCLVSHLVAIGVTDKAVNVIETMLGDLRITSGSEASSGDARQADRAQVRKLIARLLDEHDSVTAARNAYFSDRTATAIDVYRLLVAGRIGLSSLSTSFITVRGPGSAGWFERTVLYLLSPLLQLDALAMCGEFTAWSDAVSQATWPAAVATIPPSPADFSGLDKLRRPVTSTMFPALDRSALLHFRMLAERRMAAIALALRLYQADHGELPGQLEVLVPAYLDELPFDPFASGRRPFGYLPHRQRPILYGVGENGSDDGGRVAVEFGYVDYQRIDQVFFLDGPRPKMGEDLPLDMLISGEPDGDQ